MAITLWQRRKPFEGLLDLLKDYDDWFDNYFHMPGYKGNWMPAVDIEEKDGKYLLRADLPGVKKSDLHVELKDGYLTLKGVKESKQENKKHHYWSLERSYGCFQRCFKVPEGVTEKDIKAKYRDGVLELSMTVPESKKPKTIDIKVE